MVPKKLSRFTVWTDDIKTIAAWLGFLALLLAGVWAYADGRYVSKNEQASTSEKNSREHRKLMVRAARTEAIVEMMAQQQGLKLPPKAPEESEGEGTGGE